MSLLPRTLVQGETESWPLRVRDADGNAVDMTAGTRRVDYRLKHRKTKTITTLSTDESGEFTWETESEGDGDWNLTTTATLALTEGEYDVDATFYDTSTSPVTKRWLGQTRYTVRKPSIGAL